MGYCCSEHLERKVRESLKSSLTVDVEKVLEECVLHCDYCAVLADYKVSYEA